MKATQDSNASLERLMASNEYLICIEDSASFQVFSGNNAKKSSHKLTKKCETDILSVNQINKFGKKQ